MDGTEPVELVERTEGVTARQAGHRLPISRVHLPPDFGQVKHRHAGEFLQAPERVAGLDRGVLLDVAHQQEPVVVAGGKPAKIAHLPHGNESRLIDNQHPALGRLLHRLVGEQLLERIRFRREFPAKHIGRARRRRAAKHPATGLLDTGDHGF